MKCPTHNVTLSPEEEKRGKCDDCLGCEHCKDEFKAIRKVKKTSITPAKPNL